MRRTGDVLGEDKMEDKTISAGVGDLVSVFLTCISCGNVEEIHVFRERQLPPKVYWDCHDCQKNGRPREE